MARVDITYMVDGVRCPSFQPVTGALAAVLSVPCVRHHAHNHRLALMTYPYYRKCRLII